MDIRDLSREMYYQSRANSCLYRGLISEPWTAKNRHGIGINYKPRASRGPTAIAEPWTAKNIHELYYTNQSRVGIPHPEPWTAKKPHEMYCQSRANGGPIVEPWTAKNRLCSRRINTGSYGSGEFGRTLETLIGRVSQKE
jgi:hypothetical protein